MQAHLCRTLAHHLIYLGTRLDLPISSTTERFILDMAPSMWNKEGRFVWKTDTILQNREREHTAEEEDVDGLQDEYLDLNFDLAVDNWPVYLTETYCSHGSTGFNPSPGPNPSPQEQDFSSTAFTTQGDWAEIQLLALFVIPILKDTASSLPETGFGFGFERTVCHRHLPALVPRCGIDIIYTSCASYVPNNEGYITQALLGFLPNWLLV